MPSLVVDQNRTIHLCCQSHRKVQKERQTDRHNSKHHYWCQVCQYWYFLQKFVTKCFWPYHKNLSTIRFTYCSLSLLVYRHFCELLTPKERKPNFPPQNKVQYLCNYLQLLSLWLWTTRDKVNVKMFTTSFKPCNVTNNVFSLISWRST